MSGREDRLKSSRTGHQGCAVSGRREPVSTEREGRQEATEGPRRRFGRRRYIVGRAGLLCGSLLIGMIILEGGVRLLLPRYVPRATVVFHKENGVPLGPRNYTGRHSNTTDYDVAVRINQYGFRDTQDLRHSDADDLFVVGDSFSFGWGVEEEDRYSNLLATMLGTDVYNISIPTDIDGYHRLVQYARAQGATISKLIVGICMENDLRDYRVAVRDRATSRKSGVFLSFKTWLTYHSATYNTIKAVVHENGPLRKMALKLRLITSPADRAVRQVYSQALIESSVERLVRMVKECGIPRVIVMVIPSRLLWMGDDRDTYARIHREFVAAARDRGLTVVDLRTALEEGGHPLSYHFRYDGHWNRRGHCKAAEEISERFRPL